MIAIVKADKHSYNEAQPSIASPQNFIPPQKTVNAFGNQKTTSQLKAYQFYILFMIFLLIALAGLVHIGLTYGLQPYHNLRNLDNYSELIKFHYEGENKPRNKMEREIEEAKKLILSNDRRILPFEMYSYLVHYKTMRDMYKNTDLQVTNKHEKHDGHSYELSDNMVNALIETYKVNKIKCITIKTHVNWLQVLTRVYENKEGIVNYLDHQRQKLSEYCSNLFEE